MSSLAKLQPFNKTICPGLTCFLAFFIVLTVLVFGKAFGAPVDSVRAKAAVNGWLHLNQSPLQAKLGQPARRVETFADATGNPLYHVVSLDPEGFVIVAGDDLVEPIICFAASGRFDPSPENPLYLLVSNDLPHRIAQVKRFKASLVQPARNSHQDKWALLQGSEPQAFTSSLQIAGVSDVRVAPLIQTKWDQTTVAGANACYNYYTPPCAEGTYSNYPCGCVATAMAQVMRYWQYPVGGVDPSSYPITILTSTGYVYQVRSLRGGDGLGGPYIWTNMIPDPASGSTLAQRQAIGALCFDVSVALNMTFRATGSGAWMSSGAFVN